MWDSVYKHNTVPEKITDSTWRVKNIRDFSYSSTQDRIEHWVTCTIDTTAVTHSWFYTASLRQFGILRHLFAHTCMGFVFKDGNELIYSVEARRKQGEGYNPITKGMTGGYEVIHLFTTFNDLSGFRKIARGQGLERYPLTFTKNELYHILEKILHHTANQVAAPTPDVYNSVNNQCTTALLEAINRGMEKQIPRHPYWHITGLSPYLLAKHNLLDLSKKETI